MRRRTVFGIIFIVAGLLKLADMWNIVHLDWLWQQPWTKYFGVGLVIYIGIELIISSYQQHPDQWLKRPLPIGDEGRRTRLFTNFGLQRDLNLKRMGSLTFDLRCYDLFHTNETNAVIYGLRELTVHNPARRTFVLNITWKFNEARSKYRGSGAGEILDIISLDYFVCR